MSTDEKANLDKISEEEVERFLEMYRERFKVERHDGVKAGIQIVLVGDPLPEDDMRWLRERLAKGNVDLVIPAEMTPEERHQRQIAIVDSGMARMSQIIAKALASHSLSYEMPELDEPKLEPEFVPKAVQHPKNERSFKSYQNQFKGKGPPARRAFAQIRPPRRGGR